LSSGRTKYPRKFFKKIETTPDKKNADAPKKVLPAEFCKKRRKFFPAFYLWSAGMFLPPEEKRGG